VLLVQPERDDRDMYAEYLSHMGLTPICVQDADAALRLACRADIIVTELLLPGALDGYELIHRLKHSAPTGNIPGAAVIGGHEWVGQAHFSCKRNTDLARHRGLTRLPTESAYGSAPPRL